MTNRRILAAGLAAASVLAGALLVAPASATVATGGGGHGNGQCSLTDKTLSATASVNQPLTEQFTTYAETGGAWTGGDSTYSMKLRGGKTGWFFSDTFLGSVNPDGSRPTDSPFVNNSVVVQDAHGLSTITGGTPDAPEGIIPPEPDGSWYWIGDPAEGPRGTVQVPLLQFAKTGTGSFDFAWTANRLATLDRDSLQLQSIVDLPSATGINWGSWTLQEGKTTYIYGVADPEGVRSSYVARTQGKDALAGDWSFWNGTDWVADEAAAVPVVPYGSYGDADVFTYNAHEHPQLRKGNRLLVTYNVNTFDNVGDVYDDASIYRPRFIDVQLEVSR